MRGLNRFGRMLRYDFATRAIQKFQKVRTSSNVRMTNSPGKIQQRRVQLASFCRLAARLSTEGQRTVAQVPRFQSRDTTSCQTVFVDRLVKVCVEGARCPSAVVVDEEHALGGLN